MTGRKRYNMAELKELRKFVGITQKELAEKAGINIRHYQKIENGEVKGENITEKSLSKIEAALGLTIKEIEELDLGMFTEEARKSVKAGEMELIDLININKLETARRLSKIGTFGGTFSKCYERIPEGLFEKLSAKELAALIDAFYDAYSDGKNAKERE